MSWPMVRLGTVCTINMGQAPAGNTYNDHLEGDPLIAGAGDFGEIYPIAKKHTTESKKTSGIDDIILCIRATIGEINWSDRRYCLGRGVAGLVPNVDLLDSKYLWYFIISNKDQLISKGTGSTFKQVSKAHVAEWEIPLPPLPEQKRIAATLDKADAIRRKRQQAIELADDFLRSVFLDMFGDPVINPKRWETDKLINLCSEKMQNGAYFPKEFYSDDGVEMVHMSDAFYDEVQRGKLKRVKCSDKDLKKYSLNSHDLLISRRSLTYEGAAKPSLIPSSVEPLIFESSLIRVSPDNSKILTYFLFYYLSNESVKEQRIRKYVTGATIKGISQKNLEQVEIYVPPADLQRKFLTIAETTKKSLHKYNSGSDDLGVLFDSLSQKAFSGNL